MAMFKAFKPSGMQKIANSMGYQGDMQGFQDYLALDPMRQQQMQQYQQQATMMARGGMVNKYREGGLASKAKQVLAEREKRAQEKHAEADQIKVERAADAFKYEKDREAEAIRAISEAKSYELDTIAKVLKKNGAEIGNYDIMSKQIVALGELAASDSSKSIIMPTNVTASLGSVQALMDIIGGKDKK